MTREPLSAAEAGPLPVSYADVEGAHARISAHAIRTPVLRSSTVDARTGAQVFFKCENFQRMGAFKFRGALNAMAQLSADEARRGVITYSSGNHAQAVALAGRLLGIHATIVMPADAPRVKLEATRGYGAEVVSYDPRDLRDPTADSRQAIARRLAAERGLTVVPPFDDARVIAGQGTAAKELFEETGPLDLLLVPCGGGGLLSGCALAAQALAPHCRVIGVEPDAGDDAVRSFRTGALQTVRNPDTIADGARTESLGRLTFPLIRALVSDMTSVDDAALLDAMFFLWERMKIVVEPTGALGACALLGGRIEARGRRVGVLLSGGNVDLAWAARRRLAPQPAGKNA
jgi:threonine dehydratase